MSNYIDEFLGLDNFSTYWNLLKSSINLLSLHVTGTASVAKALSNYIDALFGYPMKTSMTYLFPMNVSFLASYPDFLSFSLVLLLSCE